MGRRKRIACLSVLLAAMVAVSASANAEWVPVYGAPPYTPGLGGYQAFGLVLDAGHSVNNAGMAVWFARKYDAADKDLGVRALRWNASGAAELGNLDTSASGVANTYARAINDTGTAVGYGYKYDGAGNVKGWRAVRWDASGIAATELGTIGTDASGVSYAYAREVNAAGTAIGSATKYDAAGHEMGSRAVRWDAGGTAATELGHLGTDPTGFTELRPNAINAAGTVVGGANKYDNLGNQRGTRAVRWDASGTVATELGNLGTDNFENASAAANSINNAGTAAGYALKYDGNGNRVGWRAVRWDAGGTAAIELDSLGATDAYGGAINSAGTIVGTISGRYVRWDASGTPPTYLDDPFGDLNASIHSVNDAGSAVGMAGEFHAIYWAPDGRAVDLNTLIDPSSAWQLQWAFSISDTNWVTGAGLFDPDGPGGQDPYLRMFLMQVPEPATPALLAAGLLLLGLLGLKGRRGGVPWRVVGAIVRLVQTSPIA